MNQRQNSTYSIALVSFFIAIIIIQTFIPWLGYIPLGIANVTIVHVTVILGAILLGTNIGAGLGLVWGSLAILRNLIQPSILSPVFINPLVAIPGRVLVGWGVGFLMAHLPRCRWSYALSGAVGSIINTVFTMSLAYLFAKDAFFAAMGISDQNLLAVIIGIMVSNGILEAVISSLLTAFIAPPLVKALYSKP